MVLRPLGKAFLFQFVNETYGGKFVEKSSGALILLNQDLSQQATQARWANVVAIGDDVKDFGVGDLVLIEALKWTKELNFEETRYWKSDETRVIAIGLDESVTYAL